MTSTTLLVSTLLLWLAVIGLGVLVLSLARQIGVLHDRIAPAGALMIANQLEVGTPAPAFDLEALDGTQISLGKPREDERRTLVYFLSPTCPICSSLLGTVKVLAEKDPSLDVVLMSSGPKDEHDAYRKRKAADIGSFPYILSEDVVRGFGVGKLPYAVLIDPAGVVRAHGLVNTREHLECLFETEALGQASMSDLAKDSAVSAEGSSQTAEPVADEAAKAEA